MATGPYAANRAQGSGLSFLDEEVHHEIINGSVFQAEEQADDDGPVEGRGARRSISEYNL